MAIMALMVEKALMLAAIVIALVTSVVPLGVTVRHTVCVVESAITKATGPCVSEIP